MTAGPSASQMRQNAFWSVLEAMTAAVLSIVTSFAVARIIGPAELGVGAAATMLHVLLWVVTNALFADAIVQRAAINDRILSSAFWASVTVGGLAMGVQAASGLGLAALIDDNRLIPMSLILAVPLPLVGAAGVVQGVLTRERAYRLLALRTLVGQGLGTVVGVWAANAGAGAWALVWQQAIGSGVGALTMIIERRWMPARCFDIAAVRFTSGSRLSVDRVHPGAHSAIPVVRGLDRRLGRARSPWSGAYRVPLGGYG